MVVVRVMVGWVGGWVGVGWGVGAGLVCAYPFRMAASLGASRCICLGAPSE